ALAGNDARRARVFHQLPDAVVDLRQVFVDGLARFVADRAHFDLETHAGQGRAQIVRYARQHDFAVGFSLAQVARHAVEGDVHFADLERAFFGQGRRSFAARKLLRHLGQLGQGAIDEADA